MFRKARSVEGRLLEGALDALCAFGRFPGITRSYLLSARKFPPDTREDYTNTRRLCVVATRSLPRGALCNTEVSVTSDIIAPPKARRPRWVKSAVSTIDRSLPAY